MITEPKEYPISSAPPRTQNIPRKAVPTTTTSTYTPPAHHARRHATFSSRLRTRWSHMSRRARIILIVAAVALLALILGLAIGLGTRSGTQNLPLPSDHGGPYTGDLTYYQPGLGACGITSSSSQNIVAVSHSLFDAAQSGSDPQFKPPMREEIKSEESEGGQWREKCRSNSRRSLCRV